MSASFPLTAQLHRFSETLKQRSTRYSELKEAAWKAALHEALSTAKKKAPAWWPGL
jgi:hypothetical protein